MKVNVNHWLGDSSALEESGLSSGEMELTAAQIVALHKTFDVMLHTRNDSDVPILWLDKRGFRFRQR